ncbi:MAG: hypothetical protein KGI04_02975 [Candidatus Micrarchaeota archaeon]|nr:hypothetical protein [Candidatus Micrarchaeota archaeon]
MQRGVTAYIVILAILVIVAVYLFYFSNKGTVTQITVTTTAGQSNTTTIITNITSSSTSSAPTSTVYFAGCISKNATASIQNGNFSTGTYADWNVQGPGFGSAPLNITKANNDSSYYGAPWSGYNGSFFATTYNTGTALQIGNLTSNPFVASELYLNFKIISSQSSALYVQVLKNGKAAITTHYNTYASPAGISSPPSTFVNASIPLGTLICDNVSIKVVAGVTGTSTNGKGYIAVGDFYLGKNPATDTTQPVNQTITS